MQLVVGQVGRVEVAQPGDPGVLGALAGRDAVGGQVRQRLVVLREPEDAAQDRVGGALVGDQLGDEPVEGAVSRGDRHVGTLTTPERQMVRG